MIGGSTTAISPPPPPRPHALLGRTAANARPAAPPVPSPSRPSSLRPGPRETPGQLRAPEQGPGRRGEAAKRGRRRHHLLAAGGRPGTRRRRDPARPPAARGLQVAPLQRRAATPAPGASSGRGEGERPPSPLQRRGGRPREEGGRSAGGPRTPNSASRATQPVAERSLTQLPEGNTRPRGRGKPFPAPLHTAAARPTFRFFQQLRNWGAFMAPREEDSQAERMSPLRHPFLSPSPLTHTHTHNLNSSPAVAAQPPAPLRPPGCRLLTPQAPTFSQYTSPPPPFGSGGRPPPRFNAEMSPRLLQAAATANQEPRRTQGLANETRGGGRGRGVCGPREPRGGGRAEPDPGRRLREPHVRRRGRGCLTG
ncbi:translation initiation factor IF-2-like isoform X3 [Canis lupus familiaris]|uniref:translation initiation factor IF-2-like isoform X3 n=1 Tax=Canis lupus familiaris TaxID=9615 RepID=UPI0018F5FC83|nr:translation initiation factor IF-2-like isoform X3 [Canis lupus familiaris]